MEAAFASAWECVCATPGVLRNTAYSETKRRVCGPSGLTVQFCDNHIKTKRPPSTVAPSASASASTAPFSASAAASARDATRLVSRPFDDARFNFNKAQRCEVVAEVTVAEALETVTLSYVAGSDVTASKAAAGPRGRKHPLYINVSPLFDDHSLLVPFPLEKRPQVMTVEMLREVLIVAAAFPPSAGWRFGFNSLGAWASVNHFHVHCGRAAAVFPGCQLPIERAARSLISDAVVSGARSTSEDLGGPVVSSPIRVTLSLLDDYGLPGFVYSVADDSAGASDASRIAADLSLAGAAQSAALSPVAGASGGAGALPDAPAPATQPVVRVNVAAADALSRCAGLLLEGLVERDIPHTLAICDAGRTVFVLPRKPQQGAGAEAGELVVAMAEASGLGIVYSAEDFASYTEEQYRAKLAEAALDEAVMRDLRALAVATMTQTPSSA